jgi:hypothetical protein
MRACTRQLANTHHVCAPGHASRQILWVREPAARALSAYYYIAMSERRTAAVNAVRRSAAAPFPGIFAPFLSHAHAMRSARAQLDCGFTIRPMGRRLEAERLEDRGAFAAWGYLVRPKGAWRRGAGAHVNGC